MKRELHVDGVKVDDGWSLIGSDGEDDPETMTPYFVFDADVQKNIAGPYLTYAEAANNLAAILEGQEPAPPTTTDINWEALD